MQKEENTLRDMILELITYAQRISNEELEDRAWMMLDEESRAPDRWLEQHLMAEFSKAGKFRKYYAGEMLIVNPGLETESLVPSPWVT